MNVLDPLISVIVPCYNVEKYLARCLNSIKNQTYKNLEIVVINDGSTDNTLEIVKQFAKKDSRFKMFTQANHGLAYTRQYGLSLAKGEYITYVDSDDYVTSDYVEYMFNLLKKKGFKSKMALCSLENVIEKNGNHINNGNGQIETLTGKQCIESMLYNGLVDTCAYAKLVQRDLYFSNQFPGFPKGRLFEDIATSYALFEQCSTVECGFEPKYFYVIRSRSITTGSFTKNKLDLLDMTDKMAKGVLAKYPDLEAGVIRRQVYARFSTLDQTLGYPEAKKYQRKLVKFIMDHKSDVLSNPKISRRDRLAYYCLSLGLPFYKVAWNFQLKFIARK